MVRTIAAILAIALVGAPARAERNGQRTGQAEVAQRILRQEIADQG